MLAGEKTPLVIEKDSEKSGKGGQVRLARQLTVINGIGLTVGTIIGSGIFITPNQVLDETGSVGVAFFIWIACGFLACGGALCYCELGTSIPNAGATYAYLFRAFGELPAFLYVWTAGFVIRPASRAIISLAFAEYFSRPFYDDEVATIALNGSSPSTFLFLNREDDNVVDPDNTTGAPTWLVKLIAICCVRKYNVFSALKNSSERSGCALH